MDFGFVIEEVAASVGAEADVVVKLISPGEGRERLEEHGVSILGLARELKLRYERSTRLRLVGFEGVVSLHLGRLSMNDPPTAVGGICARWVLVSL